MLTAYLDGSGVTPADDHFVLAGFVATTEKWKRFEGEWTNLLGVPRYAQRLPVRNGKTYAHAKRIAQWRPELREAFYGEANYLLRRAVLFGVAATFKHADYTYAFEKYPHTVKDSRYGLVFRCALTGCCKNINSNYDGLPLAIVIEHGDPNQGGAERIFKGQDAANKLSPERLKYNLTTLAIEMKEDWGALQAADLHAYSLLQHLRSPLGPKTGFSDRYFGDINLLLQQMQISHFAVQRPDIRNMRNAMERAVMKPKLWGQSKIVQERRGTTET